MKKITSLLKRLKFSYYGYSSLFFKYEKKLNKLLYEKKYSKIMELLSIGVNKGKDNKWSDFSYRFFKDYTENNILTKQEEKYLIACLVKNHNLENHNFFNDYFFNNKNNDWIHFLVEKQNDREDERYFFYRDLYKEFISSDVISDKDKAVIELALLKSKIEKDEMFFFNKKERKNFSSIIREVSQIIDNGLIFKNKLTSFRSLLWILSNNIITQNLEPKKIKICLENFSCLNRLGKKVIFKTLINKKQETIILNLFSHGIDLDWEIDFDGNGQKEVCSLKILEDLKLSEHLLTSCSWDILAKNSNGDNLLHMMSGSCLLDSITVGYLNERLESLSEIKKIKILNEKNNNNLPPIFQAILFQDEQMIGFLLSHGVKRWGNKEEQEDPIYFLRQCINEQTNHLLSDALQDLSSEKKIWFNILSRWESEKLNEKLENQLELKHNVHSKLVKL